MATTAPIDLKQAVKKAIANNHGVRQAREKIEQSRYEVGKARAPLFPSLSAVGTGGQYKANVKGSGTAPFGGTPYNQYTGDLKLIQPIFAFGSFASIEAAGDETIINELNLEIAVRTLTINVIQSFYKVLLNQRLLEILESMQNVVSESIANAQRRLHTGRGQLLDVLQVKTELALLKPKIEDARNELESAGAQLATYLAEEGLSQMQLKGSLKALAMKDVKARIDIKRARLPELERLRVEREQLNEHKAVAQGKHLPNLALLGNYGTTSNAKEDMFSGYSRRWSIMLQLTIPLFSGFDSYYERQSFNSQDRQLEFQGRDLENSLALAQVQSLKSLQSTTASLASAEEAADLADQSMNEARRNFRLSTIDLTQFLTVEKSTLQAASSLNTIKYNNIVAFANYFVATGQPLADLIDILQENNR